jgi:hypothetical protein
MRLQSKWSWSVALVLLATLLLTTVAYALYRYLTIQPAVGYRSAGLISDVNTTAEPDFLTPAPAFASGSGAAVMGEHGHTMGVTLD